MHNTITLSIVNHWKFMEMYGDSTVMHCSCVRVTLQLGKGSTIHHAHSLESTTQFECLCNSFMLFVRAFPFAVAFKTIVATSSGNDTSFYSYLCFSFLYWQTKPSSCVLSSQHYILAFVCRIQSCLLTPFKDVILVLKPYIYRILRLHF